MSISACVIPGSQFGPLSENPKLGNDAVRDVRHPAYLVTNAISNESSADWFTSTDFCN